MKQIDNYIIEKLHIDKEFKLHPFNTKPGDSFLVLSIREENGNFDLFNHLKFDELIKNEDENTYTIKYYSFRTEKHLERELFVNDKGYFQKIDDSTNSFKSVFLDNNDTIDFLNKVKPDEDITSLLRNKYFDSKYNKMFDKVTNIMSLSVNKIEELKHNIND